MTDSPGRNGGLVKPDVLFEDNHLLGLVKPAGVLTMGDQSGDRSMVDVAADYLREKYGKPGNVFVGVVHRLDRPVSGVLLFARTSKAAGRLSEQFRRGAVKKIYRAVVSGDPEGRATLTDWLLKDRARNLVSVVDEGRPGARRCKLTYERIRRTGSQSELEIVPHTGRSHQIRVQLASRELPIVGDSKYGSPIRRGGQILLHALRLEFQHPVRNERITIESVPNAADWSK